MGMFEYFLAVVCTEYQKSSNVTDFFLTWYVLVLFSSRAEFILSVYRGLFVLNSTDVYYYSPVTASVTVAYFGFFPLVSIELISVSVTTKIGLFFFFFFFYFFS